MTTKIKLIAGVITLAIAFAAGRYTAPEHIKIQEVIKEVEKKKVDTETKTDRDRHKKTTIVTVKRPDGSEDTTTVITDDTKTDRDTSSATTIDKTKDSSYTKEVSRSSLTLSLLAGGKVSFSGQPVSPVYGACLTKPVLGPITIGIWGLDSGVVGAAVGLTF